MFFLYIYIWRVNRRLRKGRVPLPPLPPPPPPPNAHQNIVTLPASSCSTASYVDNYGLFQEYAYQVTNEKNKQTKKMEPSEEKRIEQLVVRSNVQCLVALQVVVVVVVVSRFVIDNRWLEVSAYAFFSPSSEKVKWDYRLVEVFLMAFCGFLPLVNITEKVYCCCCWSSSNFQEGRRKRSNGRGRIHTMMPAEVE